MVMVCDGVLDCIVMCGCVVDVKECVDIVLSVCVRFG